MIIWKRDQKAFDMVESVLDFCQGEPIFLQEILQDLLGIIEPIIDFKYPNPEGDLELLEQLHKVYPQYSYIIVTNGATQALCGALEYFSHSSKYLTFFKPYWSRIPTIVNRAGLIYDENINANRLIVHPNNPNGSLADEGATAQIWDGAYYNPFYPVYVDCKPVKAECAIFSASKLFGVSGYRIGWICTNDVKIAEYVTDYVDNTSVGVSILSQKEVAGIIRHIRSGHYNKYFEKAKKILEANHVFLEKQLGCYLDTLNSYGLFGWFKVKDFEKFNDALFNAKISLMPGKAFGAVEEGYYRINLGARQDDLNAGLTRLANALNKQ